MQQVNLANSRAPIILGSNIAPTTHQEATSQIFSWAKGSEESRYVCVANVHVVMDAYDDPDFQAVVYIMGPKALYFGQLLCCVDSFFPFL